MVNAREMPRIILEQYLSEIRELRVAREASWTFPGERLLSVSGSNNLP